MNLGFNCSDIEDDYIEPVAVIMAVAGEIHPSNVTFLACQCGCSEIHKYLNNQDSIINYQTEVFGAQYMNTSSIL
jgi:hypothetical protein